MFDGIDPALILKRVEAEREKRRRENQLAHYKPYTKQFAFHLSGQLHRERLFMAGNQLGKTLAGGMEEAMHLTGRYPDWWDGRRFDHPVVSWVGGVTSEAVRDGAERILLGRAGERGTGTIPKADIIATTARQGIADSVATVKVRHISGGTSTVIFKSYDQGREKWQGDTIDLLWLDEEPPESIYTEGLTRTNAGDKGKGGLCFMTFTPLLGMSSVVKRFLLEKSDQRHVVTMTIEDVEHYTPKQRAEIILQYPEHEREARTKGIPMLGSGRIFPIAEDSITYQPFPFPKFWKRICGIDFGYDHPTAAAWLVYDQDSDTIYVSDCYRVRLKTPIIHAAALKMKAPNVPVAWPSDGLSHKDGGEPLADQYRKQGVKMLPEPARFADDKGNSVDPGLIEILDRMQTGRFKVAPHLAEWWEEFRLYHRAPSGPLNIPKIVKSNDDLMDATRYAVMMLRFARPDDSHPSDAYRSNGSRGSSSSWAA